MIGVICVTFVHFQISLLLGTLATYVMLSFYIAHVIHCVCTNIHNHP